MTRLKQWTKVVLLSLLTCVLQSMYIVVSFTAGMLAILLTQQWGWVVSYAIVAALTVGNWYLAPRIDTKIRLADNQFTRTISGGEFLFMSVLGTAFTAVVIALFVAAHYIAPWLGH